MEQESKAIRFIWYVRASIGILIGFGLPIYALYSDKFPTLKMAIHLSQDPYLYWTLVTTFMIGGVYASRLLVKKVNSPIAVANPTSPDTNAKNINKKLKEKKRVRKW